MGASVARRRSRCARALADARAARHGPPVANVIAVPFATLVLGLALGGASSLHCIAMCGPLVGGSCRNRTDGLAYGLGRLAGYACVGALAGVVGGPLLTPDRARIVQLAAATLIAAMLLLRAARFLGVGGRGLTQVRRKPKTTSIFLRLAPHLPRRGALLGVVTALFPCGALLTGLIAAAAAGGAWQGGLLMIGFAIASSPALLLSGIFGARVLAWVEARRSRWVRLAFAGVLVIVAAWIVATPIGIAVESAHAPMGADDCCPDSPTRPRLRGAPSHT